MASAAKSSSSTAGADSVYRHDEEKLEKIRGEKKWMEDVKYFKTVRVSASAAMKMMSHAKSGVEKGLASKSAMPIEIMGLMIGSVDVERERTLIVTDVFPLPVEGTETQVLTENDDVLGYMPKLTDSLELTRKQRLIGWYHSHPFDVGVNSNCFLSGTDVSTQLSWQLYEDPRGTPWLAIVVDPLRSIAQGRPEMGAFRCYPPSHTPPKGLAPDGVVWEDERARNVRWGESCVSYYQLDVEFFMSTMSSSLLGILSRGFLWTKVLASTPMLEGETRDRVSKQLSSVSEMLDKFEASGRGLPTGPAGAGMKSRSAPLEDATKISGGLAIEMSRGQATQTVKHQLFNVFAGQDVGTGSGSSASAAGAGGASGSA